ncbi:DNA integrity scanning protein DisA [Pirellulimonas nuda]|uniref:DNA integrity scanning protein DisA n=1 Tax=Pirellulimonas nuda TaxID=2528009 RepID=A0A518DJX3_9BACT|nr:DNA integrity scanning protein DisA nucleotide-binding domain protein [Pirellulimonas nuda]QDU91773.1 DNA integrity scanning protein DisA [Pirellulimonas nuda]
MAAPRRFSDQLRTMCGLAVQLADAKQVESILFLMERPTDWEALAAAVGGRSMILAADSAEILDGADDGALDCDTIVLNMSGAPVYERLTEALLEAVADDHLTPGASVVAVYSGFEDGVTDSLSVIHLDEHLGRLTVRDLRPLGGRVPTETLKMVVDLAVEIGREGREGKPVGTLFVVGEHRKVQEFCKPMGFDPVKGYTSQERSLTDAKVREGIKEIAQMDGAFVVSSKGVVIASAQHVSAPPAPDIAISKGLGARHWAAAEITRATGAIAVAISSSSGTVRVFQNGDVVLRIEPLRRAMTWRDFDSEPALPPEKTVERAKKPIDSPPVTDA